MTSVNALVAGFRLKAMQEAQANVEVDRTFREVEIERFRGAKELEGTFEAMTHAQSKFEADTAWVNAGISGASLGSSAAGVAEEIPKAERGESRDPGMAGEKNVPLKDRLLAGGKELLSQGLSVRSHELGEADQARSKFGEALKSIAERDLREASDWRKLEREDAEVLTRARAL